MKNITKDEWLTVGEGPFSDLGPDTLYMMSETEVVTIRCLQTRIKELEEDLSTTILENASNLRNLRKAIKLLDRWRFHNPKQCQAELCWATDEFVADTKKNS